jgi:hypothetical protein
MMPPGKLLNEALLISAGTSAVIDPGVLNEPCTPVS